MMTADQGEMLRALRVMVEPGDTVECRIFGSGKATISGYFNDMTALAKAAAGWSGKSEGCFVTLNPVDPVLLARASNRLKLYAKQTTGDDDILRRRLLLLDWDAVRKSGISSTEEEHADAMERAQECRQWRRAQGFPDGIEADSGNGGHDLLRIDLPNDEPSRQLVERAIKGLAFVFDDEKVKLDQSVHNASRVSKLYGTLVCKGDSTPERPHRLARLLHIPDTFTPYTLEQLEVLAALAPDPKQETQHDDRSYDGPEFDLPGWMMQHGLSVHREFIWESSHTIFHLTACPFNSDHRAPDSYISRKLGGGPIGFRCRHTSCSAYRWKQLRDMLEPNRPRQRAPSTSSPLSGTAGTQENGDTPALINETDLGNGRRFVLRHGERLRYVPRWGCWLLWDGNRWQRDESFAVNRLAHETVGSLYTEAGTLDDQDERTRRAKWAIRSENESRLNAMINLAREIAGIAIDAAELDRDPFLLTVKNGTLNLRTGELRPSDPHNLITKSSGVDYNPEAACPHWHAFLNRILPDPDLRRFVQHASGYALTGDTTEQALFFLYGSGQNGKSTFLSTLLAAMGEFALQAAPDLLIAKGENHISNDIAELKGARLVTTVEVEDGRRLAEGLVKQLTGGDRIKARFMRENFFEFEPTHKIFLAANHKPVIRGTDLAIWRRIKMIPFTVTIPPEEIDRRLGEKLRAELPGVLAWAVQGCLEWQRAGLGEPEAVKEATAGYRAEMDVVGQFIEARCITGRQYETKAGDLYKAYVDWCASAGERPTSQKVFGVRISERGFERYDRGGYPRYTGIGLVDPEHPEPSSGLSGPSGPNPGMNTSKTTHESVNSENGHESHDGHANQENCPNCPNCPEEGTDYALRLSSFQLLIDAARCGALPAGEVLRPEGGQLTNDAAKTVLARAVGIERLLKFDQLGDTSRHLLDGYFRDLEAIQAWWRGQG